MSAEVEHEWLLIGSSKTEHSQAFAVWILCWRAEDSHKLTRWGVQLVAANDVSSWRAANFVNAMKHGRSQRFGKSLPTRKLPFATDRCWPTCAFCFGSLAAVANPELPLNSQNSRPGCCHSLRRQEPAQPTVLS